jgi:hypothetical protein
MITGTGDAATSVRTLSRGFIGRGLAPMFFALACAEAVPTPAAPAVSV